MGSGSGRRRILLKSSSQPRDNVHLHRGVHSAWKHGGVRRALQGDRRGNEDDHADDPAEEGAAAAGRWVAQPVAAALCPTAAAHRDEDTITRVPSSERWQGPRLAGGTDGQEGRTRTTTTVTRVGGWNRRFSAAPHPNAKYDAATAIQSGGQPSPANARDVSRQGATSQCDEQRRGRLR